MIELNARVQGANGVVPCAVLGEVNVQDKPYLIISLGVSKHVDGVLANFLIVQPHLVHRNIPDTLERVKEETNVATN